MDDRRVRTPEPGKSLLNMKFTLFRGIVSFLMFPCVVQELSQNIGKH